MPNLIRVKRLFRKVTLVNCAYQAYYFLILAKAAYIQAYIHC